MKIEQLIVQYLYSNTQVTLQDIGVFTVSEEITIPTDVEKDTVLPNNSIYFKYDPKAGVDDGLITFVMENTRKIRPLAAADLESFVILNKQFLNIGKPLIIEGIGILQKGNDGSFGFTQSTTSHVVMNDTPKIVTEKLKEKISFATPEREIKSPNKFIPIALLGLLLLGIGVVAYYFLKKNSQKKTTENDEKISQKLDTDTAKNVKTDTAKYISSNEATVVKAVPDSNTFYIVLKEYSTFAEAKKRYDKLTSYGNKLVISTKDSLTYSLKIPFRKPIADTARVRDSINVYFAAKSTIVLP